jgi:hypothetical protein
METSARPVSSDIVLSCTCGAVHAVGAGAEACARLCSGLICHCSMCAESDRREAYGGGVPWVAFPRLRFDGTAAGARADALIVRRSSGWAARGACGACDSAVFMQYDCEAHTTWVHADLAGAALAASGPLPWAHIFDASAPSGTPGQYGRHAVTGFPTAPDFGPWDANPDPCRPAGIAAPEVCAGCFQAAGPLCRCGRGATVDAREAAGAALDGRECEFYTGQGHCVSDPGRPPCLSCRVRFGDEALDRVRREHAPPDAL